jgi:hypothetical protein
MTAKQSPGTVSDTAHHMLRIYLNNHLVGAAAGVQLAERVARAHRRKPAGSDLALIAQQIREDYEALLRIMHSVDVRPRRTYALAGQVGEMAGRLKPNGRLVRRSPLASLVELEALRLGVEGKRQGWQVLAGVAAREPPLVAGVLSGLQSKAERQAEILEAVHRAAALPLTQPNATAQAADD